MNHNYQDEEIITKFLRSVNCLVTNDSFLLENDAQEKSITHKLAEYLQNEFPDLKVDCEYNRHMDGIKKRANGTKFSPDIVVHRRGTDQYNMLIVEAKKSNGEDNNEVDRLMEATSPKHDYRYQLGIFIIFNVLDGYKKEPMIELFKEGAQIK